MKGKVKWFNDQKGYGFINPDENPTKDVFVHHSAVIMRGRRTLVEGQEVEFDETAGRDGKPAAQNVHVVVKEV